MNSCFQTATSHVVRRPRPLPSKHRICLLRALRRKIDSRARKLCAAAKHPHLSREDGRKGGIALLSLLGHTTTRTSLCQGRGFPYLFISQDILDLSGRKKTLLFDGTDMNICTLWLLEGEKSKSVCRYISGSSPSCCKGRERASPIFAGKRPSSLLCKTPTQSGIRQRCHAP